MMPRKETQVENSYQEKISEEVSDGGGCIEAWNATNANRNESTSGSTRRAVIKILSTSAVSAAGLGALGGQAAAEESETDEESEADITEITGPRANKLAARAKRSDKLKDLEKTLRKEEASRIVKNDPAVLEIESEEEEPVQTITFEIEKIRGLDKKAEESEWETANADVTIAIKEGDTYGKATISYKRKKAGSDDILINTKSYIPTEDGIQSSTTEAVVELDPKTTDEGGLAIASSSRSTECFACQLVGDTACAVGCGVGVTAICLGTAVANLGGGLACGAIATAFCAVVTAGHDRYTGASCAGDFGIEYACYYAGYCNEPT